MFRFVEFHHRLEFISIVILNLDIVKFTNFIQRLSERKQQNFLGFFRVFHFEINGFPGFCTKNIQLQKTKSLYLRT